MSSCQSNLGPVDISASVMRDANLIEDGAEYITLPYDAEENVTYMCTVSPGTVLWQLGGCDIDKLSYQMVDRDEFLVNGIAIHDSIGMSMLTIHSGGRTFLSQQFQSNIFTVQCLSVLADVNLFNGSIYTVELYGML